MVQWRDTPQSGSGGLYPNGSLYSDGANLFGMTSAGGTNNIGTIFNYALLTTGTVENIEKIGFAVYPNPSNGTIAIEAERNEYMLHITNVLGEIIYQSKIKNYKSEIDLGKQTNGIYFINIQTVKGTAVQKLIINK